MKTKQGRQRGQGLVELALILPLLLLVIFGIFDFGRILFVYVNLFNAAREGSRYGLVNPRDYLGINGQVRNSIALIPPNDVAINIWYDHGPGTDTFIDPTYVVVGDRVLVEVSYRLVPITPVIQPIAPEFPLRTIASRTIQSMGYVGDGGGGGIPAPTPVASATTPGATVTPAVTSTPTPGGATATATPVPPATATPTLAPLNINEPLVAGATSVSGTGQPGQQVTLRIVQTGLQKTGTIGGNGAFSFDGLPALVAGYTVLVAGYGQQDTAVVVAPTPTPAPTPTSTPTPTGAYLTLGAACYNSGTQVVTVKGFSFPTSSTIKKFGIFYDGTKLNTMSPAATFSININVNVTANATHTVLVRTEDNQGNYTGNASVSISFYSPCPNTPTPTATATATPSAKPDLRAVSLSLLDTPPLGNYQKLRLSMSVANSGTIDVSSLFWVDLYGDVNSGVPITQQMSLDYVAVNGLPGGSVMTFTMFAPDGFNTPGVHTLVAVVDTWNQVVESSESNNQTSPLTVTLTITNPMPTVTPTPAVTPGAGGGIQGMTQVGAFLQNNVSVYVYDATGRLRWSGRSDSNASYLVTGLPAGSYTVVGQMRIGNKLYYGAVPVSVSAGVITTGVDLVLQEIAAQ